ncbi:hypothetical protein KHU50_006286 [Colletotrichum sp. SAR 10_65]|nr:hypothetical protein K4K52_002960 [Colletotrichum sp. SAR 10_76]KAI8208344.1 hypothetical protein KHU50_006286 [Colletotrichum sp. SAR 10_65]KAI8290089.1 hypothetical protein K4K60_006836 [Colletotrichum sp. SAR11_57]
MGAILRAVKKNKVGAVVLSVFDWYPSHYPAAERKLLRKLDLAILVFGSLSFFCRFLGQQNVTNAYVSGMREDLNAWGNELNYYVVACFLEASSFGGTHLILGSWFKNEELFKRAGVWFMGNSLGSMFSGYLQAAAYRNLNGVYGRAGWRWLFIVQGIITLPISFLGFAFWPGLPISPKRWFFTDEEYALAIKRMPTVETEGITWKTFKYTLSRPMWWICVPCYIFLCQAHYWTGYMALWLRDAKYSIELVNILPTFIDLLRALSSWLGTTLAVLSIWNVPDILKFCAFYFGGFSGMASPILYSWLNFTLKENYGERGLIISSMMTLGFCNQIWIPLFTFPTVEAPRYPHGYPAATVFEVAMWAFLMFGTWYMKRWKLKHPDLEMRLANEEASQDAAGVTSDSDRPEAETAPAYDTKGPEVVANQPISVQKQ